MVTSGWSKGRIGLLWWGIAVISAIYAGLATVAGFALAIGLTSLEWGGAPLIEPWSTGTTQRGASPIVG